MSQRIMDKHEQHLSIGVATFEAESLKIIEQNELFSRWFSDSNLTLDQKVPELKIDKLKKRLPKGRGYSSEHDFVDSGRNKVLKLNYSSIENDSIILVEAIDSTKEKEMEFMIDSYAKLSEKNKKELERALSKIKRQNDRMLKELEIARQVQMGMLPFDFNPENENVDFAALLKPAKEVGGDFFDIFYIDNENLCICVGDVSDKGAGSALFMAATKTLIKSHAINSKSTASVVSRINNELVKNNDKCMFSTLFVGILNINTGSLLFSNCGHCYPFLINEDKSVVRLEELNGPAIGIVEDFSYTEQETTVEPNQTLLVYSDGVTESMDSEKNLYTEGRLTQLIADLNAKVEPELVINTIFDSVVEYEKDTEQTDDITILAIKYSPK